MYHGPSTFRGVRNKSTNNNNKDLFDVSTQRHGRRYRWRIWSTEEPEVGWTEYRSYEVTLRTRETVTYGRRLDRS